MYPPMNAVTREQYHLECEIFSVLCLVLFWTCLKAEIQPPTDSLLICRECSQFPTSLTKNPSHIFGLVDSVFLYCTECDLFCLKLVDQLRLSPFVLKKNCVESGNVDCRLLPEDSFFFLDFVSHCLLLPSTLKLLRVFPVLNPFSRSGNLNAQRSLCTVYLA